MTARDESRIFLVGPMGAGKTTIGNQLARSLNLDFIDLDQELERRTGASESGFRERERKLIDELTLRDRTVLATGGGAVLAADNRQCLSRRGFVVYLKAPLETLVERTRYDTSRPLLHSGDPAATLGEILQVRDPLYAEVADLVLDSGKLSVKQVLKMITEELQ